MIGDTTNLFNSRNIRVAILVSLAIFVIFLFWIFPEPALDQVGPKIIINLLIELLFCGVILLASAGIGSRVLFSIGLLNQINKLEWIIFGIPSGLGILAYGIAAVGLTGLLNEWVIYAWLILFLVLGISALNDRLDRQAWKKLHNEIKRFNKFQNAAAIITTILILITLTNALTPAWYQDSLMYHLHGAKVFLDARRIFLLPETWQANGPFSIEMIYLVGLVNNSTTFAKLIHFSYGLLLLLGTYSLGMRIGDQKVGFWGAVVIATMPVVMLVASLAYSDVAWAVYSFLGVYAVLRWQEEDKSKWLFLAGLMMGFSLGIKYLAWGQLAVVGLYIVWKSWNKGIRGTIQISALLVGTAVLVGSPWYMKNWFLSGNPVYPFFLGGEGWSQERLASLAYFLNSFGSGKSIWDFLRLPWDMYVHLDRFSTSPFDAPSFLLILIPYQFWMRRNKMINGLFILTFLGIIPWWFGSQQSRFLLPLLPGFSLLAAYAFVDASTRSFQKRIKRIGIKVVLNALVILQIFYVFSFIYYLGWFVRPLPVILGMESKASFLTRMVPNFSALQYVENNYPVGTGISVIWEGAGYYCDGCNLATSGQWTLVATSQFQRDRYTDQLRRMNMDLILYNHQNMEFFLQHDPQGDHKRIAEFLLNDYLTHCGREVYRSDSVSLYHLTCN